METDSKTLIHRSRRGDRLVEIFDRENFRYLYFNTKFLQSKMALDAPHLLLLPYTRYMMLSLMFLIPDPKRILLIGLVAILNFQRRTMLLYTVGMVLRSWKTGTTGNPMILSCSTPLTN